MSIPKNGIYNSAGRPRTNWQIYQRHFRREYQTDTVIPPALHVYTTIYHDFRSLVRFLSKLQKGRRCGISCTLTCGGQMGTGQYRKEWPNVLPPDEVAAVHQYMVHSEICDRWSF